MNIKILKNKPILTDIKGEQYVDLTYNGIVSNLYDSILGICVIYKSTEMRPDLVCLKYYGTTEYIDILLTSNNICNPFS